MGDYWRRGEYRQPRLALVGVGAGPYIEHRPVYPGDSRKWEEWHGIFTRDPRHAHAIEWDSFRTNAEAEAFQEGFIRGVCMAVDALREKLSVDVQSPDDGGS